MVAMTADTSQEFTNADGKGVFAGETRTPRKSGSFRCTSLGHGEAIARNLAEDNRTTGPRTRQHACTQGLNGKENLDKNQLSAGMN